MRRTITKIDRAIIDSLAPWAQINLGNAGAKLAACLGKGSAVYCIGFNQRKTHPFQARYAKNKDTIYLHAEIDALVKAVKAFKEEDIGKMTMYVCRVHKSGEKAMAKPCIGCISAIAAFGIKRVIFTDNNGEATLL